MAIKDYMREGFDIHREGFPDRANYYIQKGKHTIELDYDRRVNRNRRFSDYPYHYTGTGESWIPEAYFDTLEEALEWFDGQIDGGRVFNDFEGFEAERKVRTMSGKPHTPRTLVKDKNITPKEAAKKMKLEADEGTFYDEGRSAARMVFMPEMKDRESFGLMDSEYMIQFSLKPDELIAEMENGSSRYNQFSWGWGQEWDKLTSEYMLNPDEYSNESYQDEDFYNQSAEEFEGEWMGVAPFQEYFPDEKELFSWGGLIALGMATLIGYEGYRKYMTKNAETFGASEACSEDADCPEGKVCVDGKCLTICVDDGDCPSWMECRDDLHPTEKVCGEDKTDSDENPFSDLINRRTDEDENPNDSPSNTKETYSTTTKALFGVGIVGAIGIGIKVLGGMQDGGE